MMALKERVQLLYSTSGVDFCEWVVSFLPDRVGEADPIADAASQPAQVEMERIQCRVWWTE